jgi:predicted NBD/HSP70 family sugar kinase
MLIAVDTGGTKTLIASFSEDGTLGESFKFETPKDKTDYINLLKTTIDAHYPADSIDAIVVALPGHTDPKTGRLIDANHLNWHDFDAKAVLSETYNCPILIENDANLAGLAEARRLSPVPGNCLYITISTGIGTGIITDGHINPTFSESESGDMVLEYKGTLDLWEDIASGKAIYETYGHYAHDITDEKTWQEIADKISRGLLTLIPILRPEIIIIGGSIGTYFDRYSKTLIELLDSQLPHVPLIVAANHPEQAVIYGCYYYALDNPTPAAS